MKCEWIILNEMEMDKQNSSVISPVINEPTTKIYRPKKSKYKVIKAHKIKNKNI